MLVKQREYEEMPKLADEDKLRRYRRARKGRRHDIPQGEVHEVKKRRLLDEVALEESEEYLKRWEDEE